MALSVVFLVYVIFRMAIFNSSWERHHTIAFAVSTMVQYMCYSVIFSHIEGGGTIDQKGGMVSPCRDILYLLMFSQTISLYTVWAWCVMIVVPVFATHYFITVRGLLNIRTATAVRKYAALCRGLSYRGFSVEMPTATAKLRCPRRSRRRPGVWRSLAGKAGK